MRLVVATNIARENVLKHVKETPAALTDRIWSHTYFVLRRSFKSQGRTTKMGRFSMIG